MKKIPSRELLWGSFHIAEDEREMQDMIHNVVESLLAFINPEAYKKYKNKKNNNTTVVSETFAKELERATGMTQDEIATLMDSKDDGIEFPEEPFAV